LFTAIKQPIIIEKIILKDNINQLLAPFVVCGEKTTLRRYKIPDAVVSGKLILGYGLRKYYCYVFFLFHFFYN